MPRSAHYVVATLALAACAKLDTPLRPPEQLTVSGSLTSPSTLSRAWKSRCEARSVFTDPTTLRITGVCSIAAFGRVTLDATESVVPQPDGSYALTTTSTYTAANGDFLSTTSKGRAVLKADFSGVTFTGVETAAGGTGRFFHATGTATRTGGTRFSDNSGSYANVGELTVEGRYCTCLPPT
jgi:hypothetical protein